MTNQLHLLPRLKMCGESTPSPPTAFSPVVAMWFWAEII